VAAGVSARTRYLRKQRQAAQEQPLTSLAVWWRDVGGTEFFFPRWAVALVRDKAAVGDERAAEWLTHLED